MAGARGPNAAGRASKTRIIRAASGLVERLGHRSVSIKQVAHEANLTDAGVLHHFPTRENLLTGVLDARDADDDAAFRSGSSIDGFLQLMRANMSRPNIVRLFATMSAEATAVDNPVHEEFVSRYARAATELAADIRARQESGEFRADCDPLALAQLVIAAADGLQVQWLYDESVAVPDILAIVPLLLRTGAQR